MPRKEVTKRSKGKEEATQKLKKGGNKNEMVKSSSDDAPDGKPLFRK